MLTPGWRIILLFVFGGGLIPVFVGWEYYRNQYALIPRVLISNRTEWASAIAMFFYAMAMLGGVYQVSHPLFTTGVELIPSSLSSTRQVAATHPRNPALTLS